MILKFD